MQQLTGIIVLKGKAWLVSIENTKMCRSIEIQHAWIGLTVMG